jgi:prepilin-type N-terminal cleavage/methylation domain-containing protein
MKKNGFTLIELLIVIAIILILISIALPNFLEAQIRAKVVRMRGDARSMAIAAISYRGDFGKYPIPNEDFYKGNPDWICRQGRLTTPIKYIQSLPKDIFRTPHAHNMNDLFDFEVKGGIPDDWFVQDPRNPLVKNGIDVYIRSWGPDRNQEYPFAGSYDGLAHRSRGWSTTEDVYSATNGTVSRGDLWGLLPGPIYY